MKRIVSLVLALSMVLSMFSFSFAGSTLPDVEGTNYEAAVSALVELGIVNGYEDGTYKADRTVSRAEMAKFLVVSAGLEPAADVSKGATSFTDVDANHWATGYINVATEYGYINGYPEGTFAPDATVSYAEAATMAIRVLGYKSVVEAKGTWPTNYIAKAQELKVLKDVKYSKYTDGATRGNVALLMWNMLTTDMWDVESENENTGLTYKDTGITMIDKYFEDYTYVGEDQELVVTGVAVEDGVVTLTVTTTNSKDEVVTRDVEIAEGIDFLNLFGRTISVLYNEEEEKLVMVTPSSEDNVVANYKNELSGDKYVFSGEALKTWGTATSGDEDYVVAVIGTKKNVDYATQYSLGTSIIVEELKTKNDKVIVNASDLTLEEDDIVLIDGEWATADDLKVDDVITVLQANEVYAVSRNVVKGEFESLTKEENADESKYYVTVDGEDYSLVKGVTEVVELDEEDEVVDTTSLEAILAAKEDKENGEYYGEEAKLYLNFLGEVVKITFGEVEANEDAGYFYVLTNTPKASWTVSDKNGETTYVELNGESYEVKSGVVPTENKSGDVVYVTLDSKDRVTAMYSIPASGDAISGDYIVDIVSGEKEIYDEDAKTVSGEKEIFRINSNTTVVTITPVEDEEDENVVDHYEVATSKGAAALEGIKYAVVVRETEDSAFKNATYVFVWEDAKNTDKTYGIVTDYKLSKGVEYLTMDDGTVYTVEEYTDPAYQTVSGDQKPYVGRAIEFAENEDGITVTTSYAAGITATGRFVEKVENSRAFVLSGDSNVYDLNTTAMETEFKDVNVFLANFVDGDEGYEFTSFELVDFADIKVRKDDKVVAYNEAGSVIELAGNLATVDTIVIMRGL